ncbi:MAG: outer membrane lipoprotein chaperone LolA [Candidatus Edwardsbacteria bacterium]
MKSAFLKETRGKIKNSFIFLFSCFFATGCFEVKMETKIKFNGSCYRKVEISTQTEDLLGKAHGGGKIFGIDLDSQFLGDKKEWKKKKWEKEGTHHLDAEGNFKNVQALCNLNDSIKLSKAGFLKITYLYEEKIKTKEIFTPHQSGAGFNKKEVPLIGKERDQPEADSTDGSPNFVFKLSLPGEIISSNASKIERDIAFWKFKGTGQDFYLVAKSEAFNKFFLISLVIIILFFFTLLYIFARRPKVWFLILLFYVGLFCSRGICLTSEEIATRAIEHLKGIEDFSTRFACTKCQKESGICQKFSGRIFFKKPDRLRLEINFPEEQLIVSDGNTLWIYLPKQKQVIKQMLNLTKNTSWPDELSLENYETILKMEDKKYYILLMRPKRCNLYVAEINLVMEKDVWLPKKIEIKDIEENESIYFFEKAKINSGLNDSKFYFHPPKNVEIIEK